MRRITREQLRTDIYVALTVLKPWKKRALGIGITMARNQVTEDLVSRIMGRPESEAVVLAPSPVFSRDGERHGRWGEDEPHPDAYLPPERALGAAASAGSPEPER